jgi:arginine/lysine/ornithine decarboxylase
MPDAGLPPAEAVLVSGDAQWRNGWMARLQAAEGQHIDEPRPCRLNIHALADESALFELAASNGLLQAVVLDTAGLPDVRATVSHLRALRSEIDLFLAVTSGAEFDDIGAQLLERDDPRVEILLRQLRRAIGRRARTPFADTLREYVEGARDAWHTPGHSSGDGLRDSPWVADFYRMMGEHVFNADLSVSVQELDSLLDPVHVLQEAQDLAAVAFGARRTFFVTNGTSTANKVIVQHVLGNGGKMIVDQACHKSVHHAAVLFGIDPVYLPASVNPRYGFYGPVTRQRVFDAIDAHPDAQLLVLTSCTYDGFYYDLAPLVERAHAAGMKVLVDEAWYAHGYFHPALRPCALECGADYVTQSTHKMLCAFSQASMIHVGDPDFDEARFREHLNMHTSTSPQYAMIASLDVARKQMSMEGFSRLSRSMGFAAQLREGIARSGCFRVLELEDMLPDELREDNIRLDPTKLSIDVSDGPMSARQLQRALYERYSIQVEKTTHNTLSVLVTLGTTQSKVLRLINALRQLAVGRGAGSEAMRLPVLPPLTEMARRPRDAYFGPSRLRSLTDDEHGINTALVGAVSAYQVVPYPPGIPVLVPGQRITRDVLRFLLDLHHADTGIELHGVARRDGRLLLRILDEPVSSTPTTR